MSSYDLQKGHYAEKARRIGDRIRRVRNACSLTQDQFADSVPFLSKTALSRIENGHSLPDLRAVISISELYRIDLALFFQGISVPEEPNLAIVTFLESEDIPAPEEPSPEIVTFLEGEGVPVPNERDPEIVTFLEGKGIHISDQKSAGEVEFIG